MQNIRNEETKFLTFISNMVNYWGGENVSGDTKSRLEGLAFSILSHMDGCSGEPYNLIPSTNDGDNYYFSMCNNISGCLHERFFDIHSKNSNLEEAK